MRVSFYFERSCPEQRPRAALKPQEPRSSGSWTPGAPAPARRARSSRVVEPWSRGKWQAAGATSVVGKAVLTLYPPLRPLSHNVNPRDGVQDIPITADGWLAGHDNTCCNTGHNSHLGPLEPRTRGACALPNRSGHHLPEHRCLRLNKAHRMRSGPSVASASPTPRQHAKTK
jgi:hypothetical protein